MLPAATEEQYRAARSLIEEYAAELQRSSGVDLSFQDLAAELDQLSDIYGPPHGLMLLAGGRDWVGCAALRAASDGACEMKRLYVRPDARGAGVARSLVKELVQRAPLLGYRRMLLDTLEDMHAAQALYRSFGFQRTEPYCFNPLPGAVYMELNFHPAGTAS